MTTWGTLKQEIANCEVKIGWGGDEIAKFIKTHFGLGGGG